MEITELAGKSAILQRKYNTEISKAREIFRKTDIDRKHKSADSKPREATTYIYNPTNSP